MLLLASDSDVITVTTSAATAVTVYAAFIDYDGSTTTTPGRQNTSIAAASSTKVVSSPSAGNTRNVKSLIVSNASSTTSQEIGVNLTDGTTVVELATVTLGAGQSLQYAEGNGFTVVDTLGRIKTTQDFSVVAAVNTMNLVALTADVTNNSAVANTMQNVTGLSFAVNPGESYWFRACIAYTAAATATGSRWAITGPASPTFLAYKSEYSLTTTTNTVNEGVSAYDSPAASNATSATTGANTAIVEGVIRPSGSGNVILRCASEVGGSAIVAKAGSLLQWVRTV
jgi:hypothetical protein